MFGIFCKGLHCAGCGKGFPAGLIVSILVLIAVSRNGAFLGRAFGELAIILASIVAVALVASVLILRLLIHRGPPVVFVRMPANQLSYSQLKFLETGNTEWLELTGGIPGVLNGQGMEDSGANVPVLYRRTP